MFNLYPKINFKVNDFDSFRAIDLSYTTKVRDFIKNYRGIRYFPYVIRDGDRPDNVSMKVYGTPNFDWLIMLVNDMYSIYDDWPKDDATFQRYIIEKYGSISAANSTIKNYLDAKGNIIDLTTYNSLPSSQRSTQTQYEYEFAENIIKSTIKLVNDTIAYQIQSEMTNLNLTPLL